MSGLMGVAAGNDLTGSLMFGDSGAIRTSRGDQLFKRRHTFSKVSREMSSQNAGDILYLLAGESRVGGSRNKIWSDIISRAERGEKIQLDNALPISRRGVAHVRTLVNSDSPLLVEKDLELSLLF
jgi:hypothetical protein